MKTRLAMTLYRQLLIGLLFIFVLVAAGIETIYVAATRSGIQEQLASHSQDTATALGLSLATALARQDPVLAETIVGTAFDRGFFRDIRVTDSRGETLVRRQLPPTPPEVPAWFADLVPLDAPAADSLITNGWHGAGRVSVTSQPNFAYRQLWDTILASLAWLLVLFTAGAALAIAFLRAILRPLRDVEQAARSMGDGNFVTIATHPGSRELQRVVATINALSTGLKGVVEREIDRAESWRRQAHSDPVSGLDNRCGFEYRFGATIESANTGVLLLFEVADLKAYNERHGYRRGDELLALLGSCLMPASPGRSLAARIGGGIFVCSATDVDQSTATKRAEALCQTIEATLAAHGFADAAIRCGGVFFTQRMPLAALLKHAYEAMILSPHPGTGPRIHPARATPATHELGAAISVTTSPCS